MVLIAPSFSSLFVHERMEMNKRDGQQSDSTIFGCCLCFPTRVERRQRRGSKRFHSNHLSALCVCVLRLPNVNTTDKLPLLCATASDKLSSASPAVWLCSSFQERKRRGNNKNVLACAGVGRKRFLFCFANRSAVGGRLVPTVLTATMAARKQITSSWRWKMPGRQYTI